MKTKLLVSILFLGMAILLMAMNCGCSGPVYESSTYYYPNWMPDGRIICYKVTSKWSNEIWGRKELGDTYYITAMNSDGSDERDLFEVSADGVKEITCSPTGELIGYITTPDSKIAITNYSGSSKTTLPGITGVSYLDWSPDATKIAYSANRKLYVVNVDGTNNAQITSESFGGSISWRVGDKVTISGIKIINIDGTGSNLVISGAYPQNYSTIEVIYLGSGGVYKINFDGSSNTKLFSGYSLATLKLSFDNTKIVGGDLITGGGSFIGGIWVTNINDGTATKLK